MAKAMTGNAIPTLQNEEPQLKLMRARTRMYDLASRILVTQLVLTLLIPALGAILVLFVPSARASIAALALLITALDVLVLDRRSTSGAGCGKRRRCLRTPTLSDGGTLP